jgi:hypothetical protein
VTSLAVRSLAIGLSFVACASLGAAEASAQVVCPKEAKEVQDLTDAAVKAIPPADGKRRQYERYRGNHCYNLLRRQGPCGALLTAYKTAKSARAPAGGRLTGVRPPNEGENVAGPL